jgi:hypothetical protein
MARESWYWARLCRTHAQVPRWGRPGSGPATTPWLLHRHARGVGLGRGFFGLVAVGAALAERSGKGWQPST